VILLLAEPYSATFAGFRARMMAKVPMPLAGLAGFPVPRAAELQRDVVAMIEHVLSDRPGNWRDVIAGSHGSDRWEMKAQAFELELAAGPLHLVLEGWTSRRGSRCNSPSRSAQESAWHVRSMERPVVLRNVSLPLFPYILKRMQVLCGQWSRPKSAAYSPKMYEY
jgi:hypothetical protein